jgi:predicted nuclease of predicted toxin-antitoxin system
VRFLVDRCAGRRLANWLRQQGHDVRDARDEVADPGDAALLRVAVAERRALITIDTDFGTLVYLAGAAHAGIIRLPDVPARSRIALVEQILLGWTEAEIGSAMIIVTGNRIRFSRRQPDPLFASAFLKLLPLVLAELVEFGEHGEV